MAQQTPSTSPTGAHRDREVHDSRSAWVTSGTMFAGVLFLIEGALGVIKGISGIARDDVYSQVGDYTFKFDVTAWGWIHLVLGLVLAVVGAGLLKGALWARATGVVLAAISIILNFMWLPYTPIWAVISIAISGFIIWALCSDGGRARA